jgi:tyrosyl-tRNA synthetase
MHTYIPTVSAVHTHSNSPQGISFTEFSYQIFQAYDFLQLFEREKCTIQIGGSDQWGNISGYGVTVPLLTTASGVKIGKSTGGGSVWLSTHKTSSYDFYQVLTHSLQV